MKSFPNGYERCRNVDLLSTCPLILSFSRHSRNLMLRLVEPFLLKGNFIICILSFKIFLVKTNLFRRQMGIFGMDIEESLFLITRRYNNLGDLDSINRNAEITDLI